MATRTDRGDRLSLLFVIAAAALGVSSLILTTLGEIMMAADTRRPATTLIEGGA